MITLTTPGPAQGSAGLGIKDPAHAALDPEPAFRPRPGLPVRVGHDRSRAIRREEGAWVQLRIRRIDPDAVLGDVFHEARLAAGLTCEQAADRSGLSPTRIAGIEDGDGLLIFADAMPLARAYGRSLRELSDRFEAVMAIGQEVSHGR